MTPTPKILVAYADDHQLVRTTIVGFINASNNNEVIIEASNGKELIERIEDFPLKPDVCLVDINMPELNGFDTVVALKKKWPSIKVLVVSVFNNDLYIIKMIVSGADGYITKDCSPEELLNAISTLYKNGVYYSGHFSIPFINAIKQKMVRLPDFTNSELDLLKLCCTDLSYSQIAQNLQVSTRSVEGHRDSLFKKLQVQSRTGLVMYAVRSGIVPLEINATERLKR
jgi:two-component system, NarL family, invasion response regulator UvrY